MPRLKPRYLPLTAAILFAAVWYYPLLSGLLKPSVIVPIAQAIREDKTPTNNTLFYPNLGITSPLIVSKETSPLKYQDWNTIRQALRNGVNLAFTEESFDNSNFAFVTGHSSDTYPHKHASIFAGLGQAKVDDEILLNIDETIYVFKVVETKVLNPTDIKDFEELQKNESGKKRIALVTCWPVLTTKNRLVIMAEESD